MKVKTAVKILGIVLGMSVISGACGNTASAAGSAGNDAAETESVDQENAPEENDAGETEEGSVEEEGSTENTSETDVAAEEGAGSTEAGNSDGESSVSALDDGTYTATALTTHYAASCAAGIDYDSLYDVNVTISGGKITDVIFDIGPNAKSVPESAEISMEDWPFLKLAETQAQKNLIGADATVSAVGSAWNIISTEDRAEDDIDATSGATEASRASKDAVMNLLNMAENSLAYTQTAYANEIVPHMQMFEGEVISENVDEDGRSHKTVQINDGEYVVYGLVSALNNEIDNTAVDYNYVVQVNMTVEGGKITAVDCSTPNGSEAARAAVEEANALVQSHFVGLDATNDAIIANLPFDSRSEEAFEGSVGAKIACDMIQNAVRNGCTHIVGWAY